MLIGRLARLTGQVAVEVVSRAMRFRFWRTLVRKTLERQDD